MHRRDLYIMSTFAQMQTTLNSAKTILNNKVLYFELKQSEEECNTGKKKKL